MHRPLAPEDRVVGRTCNDAVVDKEPGRAAPLYSTTELSDTVRQEPICTLRSTAFLRSEGGLGSFGSPPRTPSAVPDRAPDSICERPVSSQAALLYRLNGDFNPLHADPVIAREAGFDRPILHGLATYSAAGYSIVRMLCNGEAERLKRLDACFTAPVYPGETLRTEVWQLGPGRIAFRAQAIERNLVALNNGVAEYDVGWSGSAGLRKQHHRTRPS